MNKVLRNIFFSLAMSMPMLVIASGNYQVGGKVLSPNDPAQKVIETMGQPASKEDVQNKFGAKTGEFWYYFVGSKTVRFFISGGRIVSIEEIR